MCNHKTLMYTIQYLQTLFSSWWHACSHLLYTGHY